MTSRTVPAALAAWLVASAALAQAPLAPGVEGAPLPPGHPPVPGQPEAPAPEAAPSQAEAAPSGAEEVARRVAAGENLPVATATPTVDVPGGTVRVSVSGADGEAAPGTTVHLVVTPSMGADPSETTAETDAEGVALFEGLARGTGQSYRAYIRFEGATYGTPEFQLPPMVGYDVRIGQRSATTDTRMVIESVGLIALEIKDDRLHVTQRSTLMNLGEETVVFAGDGTRFRLPDGFTAFDSQTLAAEQTIERTDYGFDLRGSLSPGQTTIAWTFDLPLEGGEMVVDVPTPFRTVRQRVLAEASESMDLDVGGFPRPEVADQDGRRFLVTETQHDPQSPVRSRLDIRLSGIPSQGTFRWFAVGLAALLALGGIALTWVQGDDSVARQRARQQREAQLLAEIAEVERLAAREEIGPMFRERETSRLVGELALLLQDQSPTRKATAPHASPKRAPASASS